MSSHQDDEAPIIAREALLRLVELVDRLRARSRGEESDSSWTTQGAAAPEHGPAVVGRADVDAAAAGEPEGGGAVAGGAGGPESGRDTGGQAADAGER